MSVLVVGLSHHTAPVTLLERTALTGDAEQKLLHDLQQAEHVAEAMVVSTCNRVEVYAEVARFHGGVGSVSELLARHCEVPLDDLTRYLYVHYEDRAVQHLFAVACGLDSMVVGESQILGQVRTSLRGAQQAGAVGRSLDGFVQQALRIGKRAHAETGIDRAGPSLVSVGLEVADEQLSGLEQRRALIVGAGSMSALAATTLSRAGAEVVVANRTARRGQRLAESVGGRAVTLDEIETEMHAADAVVTCTGAAGLVVPAELMSRVLGAREAHRPLFVLDLALPRDVDPDIAQLTGVTITDLEALRGAGGDASSAADIETVRSIVAAEVADYLSEQRAAEVAPTVAALRSKASEVVDAELERLSGRLPELDGKAQDEVAQSMRRVVSKLLHAPTVRVKELASSPGGDTYATALRDLFDLDPQAPEAVTRADVPVQSGGEPTSEHHRGAREEWERDR